jgi:TPP-dependent pyruvate/acetoin dehydrogenase alpha subunit
MALAEKRKQSRAITVAFLGDGTLGEGVIYEAFNLAALWQIPILYVVENNRIAQTTPVEHSMSGSLIGRFAAFNIPASELDTSNVLEIAPVASRLLEEVRSLHAPRALILHTCRFGPHSKGDDTRRPEEVERLRNERDPLKILGAHLSSNERTAVDADIELEISLAFQYALADPYPE